MYSHVISKNLVQNIYLNYLSRYMNVNYQIYDFYNGIHRLFKKYDFVVRELYTALVVFWKVNLNIAIF